MKSRYDNNPGKDARIANVRHGRLDSMHSSSDAFVKKEQAAVAKYAGRNPVLKGEDFEFNAHMMNNGQHAQEFASKLTAGIDKVAFPVKPAFPGKE